MPISPLYTADLQWQQDSNPWHSGQVFVTAWFRTPEEARMFVKLLCMCGIRDSKYSLSRKSSPEVSDTQHAARGQHVAYRAFLSGMVMAHCSEKFTYLRT
ncbi:hypothetical protein TNCV_4136121 [Trichonephila clavipes]|nr:hypothetical protein TNCV_4136121 [Trichonephila clavipes]